MNEKIKTLSDYADQFGSDKGLRHHSPHGYSLFYDMLFSGRRYDKLNVLEMGLQISTESAREKTLYRVGTKTPSVDMWCNFFPNSKIYGADISDFSDLQRNDFTFIQADLSNQEDVKKISALNIQFDIIIDDASHASYDQKLCLLHLFPLLRNNGLYIIEDLQWQPERTEKKTNRGMVFSDFMRYFNRYGVFPDDPQFDKTAFLKIAEDMHYVHFNTVGNIPETKTNQCVIHKIEGSKSHYFRMKKNNEYKENTERVSAAISLYEKYPSNPDICIETVKCYVENHEYTEALKILTTTDMQHQSPESSYYEAVCLYFVDEPETFSRKREDLEKEILLDSAIYLRYIEFLISCGMVQLAEHHSLQLIETHNDRPLFDFKIGKAFLNSGLIDNGIEYLKTAVVKLPDRRQFQIALVSALSKNNRVDELQIQLHDTLTTFPNDSRIVQLAARCFLRNDLSDRVISLLKKHPSVLELDTALNKFYLKACV